MGAGEFDHFEWEFLEDQAFELEVCGRLNPNARTIRVARDDQLRLEITASGVGSPPPASSAVAGTIDSHPPAVVLRPFGFVRGQLGGVFGGDVESTFGPEGGRVEEKTRAGWLSVDYNDAPAAVLSEWVANAPADGRWPSSTERTLTSRLRRKRASSSDLDVDHRTSSRSYDHIGIELKQLPGVRIELGSVSSEYCPRKFRPGRIDFSADEGSLPESGTRDNVRLALSFAFGSELGYLGYTAYEAAGDLVTRYLCSLHMAGGPRSIGLGLPPTRLEDGHTISVEKLTRLVNGFIDAVDRYDLAHVMWLLSIARAASPYTSAAQYGAALEALRDTYLRDDTQATNRLLPSSRWKKVHARLGEALVASEAIGEISSEEAGKFVRRVENLNSRSGRDRMEEFFATLGLKIGPLEVDALNERNRVAHGVAYSEEEFPDAIRKSNALETLCNRALLALTSGADSYIDRYTLGYPERPLDEPIGSVQSSPRTV